jgi:hypothetical protein
MEMDSGLISCVDGRLKTSFIFQKRFLSIGAFCKRRNCSNRRARNPTKTIPFDYCSLKCLRLDRTEQLERGISIFHKIIVSIFYKKNPFFFF